MLQEVALMLILPVDRYVLNKIDAISIEELGETASRLCLTAHTSQAIGILTVCPISDRLTLPDTKLCTDIGEDVAQH